MPDLRPARSEDGVAEQHIEDVEDVRHVIAFGSLLWLGPGRVEALRCVARADATGERCKNLVSQGEGRWEELAIPYAPGRAGPGRTCCGRERRCGSTACTSCFPTSSTGG
ncbi:hypothetical protein ABZV80_32360 [Streptomyces sp. NPDC005132]|uniref:hypothetical protein n=1 Tax=Streptomyces sp. NPDC005132 TaxID=3154294 RepID=UPI0033B40A93